MGRYEDKWLPYRSAEEIENEVKAERRYLQYLQHKIDKLKPCECCEHVKQTRVQALVEQTDHLRRLPEHIEILQCECKESDHYKHYFAIGHSGCKEYVVHSHIKAQLNAAEDILAGDPRVNI